MKGQRSQDIVLAWAAVRPSLCGTPSVLAPRGGRAHFGAEEREGDRESPSVNSQGRRARLLKVPRDAQSKVHIWGAGTEADKGTPQRGRGGGQPHSPSPPLPCGRLRVLGIAASSPFQEDLVLVPSGLWARGSDRGGRRREAGLGPGGYSKPQQELEPFQAQDQSLDFPTQERG